VHQRSLQTRLVQTAASAARRVLPEDPLPTAASVLPLPATAATSARPFQDIPAAVSAEAPASGRATQELPPWLVAQPHAALGQGAVTDPLEAPNGGMAMPTIWNYDIQERTAVGTVAAAKAVLASAGCEAALRRWSAVVAAASDGGVVPAAGRTFAAAASCITEGLATLLGTPLEEATAPTGAVSAAAGSDSRGTVSVLSPLAAALGTLGMSNAGAATASVDSSSGGADGDSSAAVATVSPLVAAQVHR